MFFITKKEIQTFISSALVASFLLPSVVAIPQFVYAADSYVKCNYDPIINVVNDLKSAEKQLLSDPYNLALQHAYADKQFTVDSLGDSMSGVCRKILYDSGEYIVDSSLKLDDSIKSAQKKKELLLRSYAIEAVANHLNDSLSYFDQALSEIDSYLSELPATTSIPLLRSAAYDLAQKKEEERIQKGEYRDTQPCKCSTYYESPYAQGRVALSEQVFWVKDEKQCTDDTVKQIKSQGGVIQNISCVFSPDKNKTDTNLVADQIFNAMMSGFQETPYYELGRKKALKLKSLIKSVAVAVGKIQSGMAPVDNIKSFMSGNLMGLLNDAKVTPDIDDIDFADAEAPLSAYFDALRKIYRASYLGNEADYKEAEAESLQALAREIDTNKNKSIETNIYDTYNDYVNDISNSMNIGAGQTAINIYNNIIKLYAGTKAADDVNSMIKGRIMEANIASDINFGFNVVGIISAWHTYGLALILPAIQGSTENYLIWDNYEKSIEQQYGQMPVFLLRTLSSMLIFKIAENTPSILSGGIGLAKSGSARILSMGFTGASKLGELMNSMMSAGSLAPKIMQFGRLALGSEVNGASANSSFSLVPRESLPFNSFVENSKLGGFDSVRMSAASNDEAVFGYRLVNYFKALFSRASQEPQPETLGLSTAEQFTKASNLVKQFRDSDAGTSNLVKTVGGISGNISQLNAYNAPNFDVNIGIVVDAPSAKVAATLLAAKLKAAHSNISQELSGGTAIFGTGDHQTTIDLSQKSTADIANILSSGGDKFVRLIYKDPSGNDFTFNIFGGYRNSPGGKIKGISTDYIGKLDGSSMMSDSYIVHSGDGNHDLNLYRKLGIDVFGMDPLSMAAQQAGIINDFNAYRSLMSTYMSINDKAYINEVVEAVAKVVHGAELAGDEILGSRAQKTYTAISKVVKLNSNPPMTLSELEPLRELFEVIHGEPFSESKIIYSSEGVKDGLWLIVSRETELLSRPRSDQPRDLGSLNKFREERKNDWRLYDFITSKYVQRAASDLGSGVDSALLMARALYAKQKLNASGAAFDAEAEVKNILSTGEIDPATGKRINRPTEERAAALAVFKEKLAVQLQAVTTVQVEIISAMIENSQIPGSDLAALAEVRGKALGLNDKQIKTLKDAIGVYETRRRVVEKYSEGKNDKEIFKAIFKVDPVGDIRVVKGPGTLYFRCKNLVDYTRIYTSKFKGENVTNTEMADANTSGGVKLNLPGKELDGVIIAEKSTASGSFEENTYDLNTRSNGVYSHELQHALRSMFPDLTVRQVNAKLAAVTRGYAQDYNYVVSNKLSDKEKLSLYGARDAIFDGYATAQREIYADSSAADELLAYYKQGVELDKTVNYLLDKKGLYQYNLNQAHSKANGIIFDSTKDIDGVLRIAVQDNLTKITDRVFGSDYENLVRAAAQAIRDLEAAGLSKDQVIALLTHEPPLRWKKVVGRMIDQLNKGTQN